MPIKFGQASIRFLSYLFTTVTSKVTPPLQSNPKLGIYKILTCFKKFFGKREKMQKSSLKMHSLSRQPDL